MFMAYCIPEKEIRAIDRLMEDQPLTSTERGWLTTAKIRLLEELVCGVKDDYTIAAKYYMCYCASRGLFKWIEGRRLQNLLGKRTEKHLRQANEQEIKARLETMIDDLQQLQPPPRDEYTARLAMPGRTSEEIARIVGVLGDEDVNAIMASVSGRKERLAECWKFWRAEREEGTICPENWT